jgi:hypothetical protein
LPQANLDSQDSPRIGLGGSHHLPPYSILCTSPQGPHPNGFLSRDSQMGVSNLPKLSLPRLQGPITLCTDLQSGWGLKQSCSFHQELSNIMSHVTYIQGNRVDSQLLVVGSQTINLTPDLSFGHNLCFRCPNGSWKPILDIYVSIAFQWYKEFLNAMGFDPFDCSPKIWESTGTTTLKMGAYLGVWVSTLTLSHTLRLPSWPAPLQALALVASPRLRLQHFIFVPKT